MATRPLHSGAAVTFRLIDAVCPEFERIISQVGPDLEVSGEVVMLSDHGLDKEYFAVVEVAGLSAPLVVPTSKLIGAGKKE